MIGLTILMPLSSCSRSLASWVATEQIAVGRVCFFGTHLVGEAIGGHEFRHFRAAAQFVDEQLVEPGLVDPQARIGQQAVTVEPLDIVAFVGRAIAQMLTPSSFMAATSIVPVTARPSGVVLK